MNSSITAEDTFVLGPTHHGDHQEAVLLAIVKEMEIPTERRPLQCVTFKLAYPEYFLLKKICKRWKLKYTNVIRFFLRSAIAVLESPTGELLEQLEKHRESELEKERIREEAKNKRLAQEVA